MASYEPLEGGSGQAGGRIPPGDDGPLVAVVLGTRPEIVKLAPVLEECTARNVPFVLIHTGQHYSAELDGRFFEQLDLPRPDVNLGVGSGPQGQQTGSMLERIEAVLVESDPDVVLVQGDTNTTLAGALAASKLHIPVGHVEAGLRSFDRSMPEEINRILTDHVSDYLFTPTEYTADLLGREGFDDDRVFVTGNTVVDALYAYRDVAARESTALADLGLEPGEFALLTAHRAENVDDPRRFADILEGVARFADASGLPVVYPIHPRSADRLDAYGLSVPDGIRVIDPLDFLDFIQLEATAAVAFTDSGGVQEETCILGTPCVTLRYNTERPETVFASANIVAGTEPADVLEAGLRMWGKEPTWSNPFGDGTAAARILEELTPILPTAPIQGSIGDLIT